MFRYTPSRKMLNEFKQSQLDSCDYLYTQTVCRSNYTKMTAFLQHWEHTSTRWAVEVSVFPVNGILFPVSFFDQCVV